MTCAPTLTIMMSREDMRRYDMVDVTFAREGRLYTYVSSVNECSRAILTWAQLASTRTRREETERHDR